MPQLGAFVMPDELRRRIRAPAASPSRRSRCSNGFGEYIVGAAGSTQLRIAETEKYAHVTYFFNGGVEATYPGEDRILVPSPKVATYDLKPEMSASEVTDKLVAAIERGSYDAIVCNYANGDMVGHTGNLDAAMQGGRDARRVHRPRRRRAARARRRGADHRRPRQRRDDARSRDRPGAHRAHAAIWCPASTSGARRRCADGGALRDIAPTLLAMMGLPQPPEMTGQLASCASQRDR